MLGVYPIEAEIDKRKLMFFGKLCNLGLGTLSKQIFLYRLHDFIASVSDGKQISGFIRDIWQMLLKYNLMNYLQSFVNETKFPRKFSWKNIIRQSIHNYQLESWLNRTETDRDFLMFRDLHHSITPARIYKFDFSFDDIKFIKFVAKLWTVIPLEILKTCTLCNEVYNDPIQHATLWCNDTDVTTHFEKTTHFENFFQSALKIEQPQRTL
jgi:hypothetical protein